MSDAEADHHRLTLLAHEYGGMIGRMIERARETIREDTYDWAEGQNLPADKAEQEACRLISVFETAVRQRLPQPQAVRASVRLVQC